MSDDEGHSTVQSLTEMMSKALVVCLSLILVLLLTRGASSGATSTAPQPSSSVSRRPVFLKFYEVGSESVVDFFLRMSVNPRKYKSWVSRAPECGGLPMVSHLMHIVAIC